MPRDYRVYVEDILEASRRIRLYTKRMTEDDFERSPMAVDAVVRNLEVIGEAAGRIPKDIKLKAPDTEWRKIVALRNLLAHQYFGVNTKIVWDIVANKLAPLELACRKLVT
ncbi:MAG: DUF86 domain-containing protein [Candidatus Aminicenantales bacterium]